MLVSMTPNDEVKTIHASLNDGSLRKWEFEPYTENGKIELTDQDYATIQSIKGNTIKFNQLVQNGNFTDTSGWNPIDCTFTVSNNIATVVTNSTFSTLYRDDYSIPANHKVMVKVKTNDPNTMFARIYAPDWEQLTNGNYIKDGNYQYFIYTVNKITGIIYLTFNYAGTITVQDVQVFDLTAMGIDNLTTVEQVETWLSNNIGLLPYYDYTPGTLIPFNGNGIKTVGFNQWDEEWEVGSISGSTGQGITDNNYIRSKNLIRINPELQYYVAGNTGRPFFFLYYDANGNYIGTSAQVVASSNRLFTPNVANATYCKFTTQTGGSYNNDICLNISDTSKNGTYEPYTSNTLPLPTQTYFPFGEDGIGTARDELIPNTDVYKMMGIIDLGNLDWSKETYGFYSSPISNMKAPTDVSVQAILCDSYTWSGTNKSSMPNKSIRANYQGTTALFIVDNDYSSGSALKTSLQGKYLIYPLATPLHNYGVVDLGTLDWSKNETYNVMYADVNGKAIGTTNMVIAKYAVVDKHYSAMSSGEISGITWGANINIKDDNYTDASVFKTAMSGQYLLYELETPVAPSSMEDTYPVWNGGTEQILPVNGSTPTTSPMVATIEYPDRTEDVNFLYKQTTFESAIPQFSLVCKNQELPMTLEDGKLICECDSSITNESGFFDAKVKMQDLNSVAYSQKIQLHVERGIND